MSQKFLTSDSSNNPNLASEALRLEVVITSVGFDDLLNITLGLNIGQFDTVIVVTSHEDKKTQAVAKKYGAICVQTDLFNKNGRSFNKGAAINAGFGRFQYHGWRCHMDSDIVLPNSFRRMLFNHTHLDKDCLYGMDRVDVVGLDSLKDLNEKLDTNPQSIWGFLIDPAHQKQLGARYVDTLRGYCPLGFFQLWNAKCQHAYPFSLGTAEHDDILFCDGWPSSQRRLLPSVVGYHLVPENGNKWSINWEGRKSPRIDK